MNEKYLGESEGYYFYETEDGSPTVSIGSQDAEKMHHSGGALSETVYVYGDVVEILEENLWNKRLLNLGLGIGYIELLVASQTDEVDLLLSYEIDENLNYFFQRWIEGDRRNVPQKFYDCYEEILRRFSRKYKKPKTAILWNLKKWRNEKSWLCEGSFNIEDPPCNDMTGIFFDPFSSKTNASLWDEENLDIFMSEVPAQRSVLASYAATGTLKRSLKSAEFELFDKRGFKGKRESTLAKKSTGPHPYWNSDR